MKDKDYSGGYVLKQVTLNRIWNLFLQHME
jgi:hypothetical protein